MKGIVCAAGEGISAEDNGPNAMFKLSALKGTQTAGKVDEAAVPDEEDAAAELESSGDEEGSGVSDVDSDEAQRWDSPPPCMLTTPVTNGWASSALMLVAQFLTRWKTSLLPP